MKTAQIDVIDVQKTKDGYIVKYWDENFDGENNVEMQISEEALLESLPDSGMFDLAQNKQYLIENRDEVIKDYIQANS